MSSETTHQAERTSPSPPQREVLIIEDDAELADLLAHWVTANAIEPTNVQTATSLQAASEQLNTQADLDIVLLDRRFPQGMGDELLSIIYAEFEPIVLMITGMRPSEELIRLPISDYLVKPIDGPNLVKRISLLEKLQAAGVLTAYTDARKAALLEFHLEDPSASALFRRFAARWEYDRLELAIDESDAFVYELYLDDDETDVSISVVGRLTDSPAALLDQGAIRQVGEVVPSGDSFAWIDATQNGDLDVPAGGFAICSFEDDDPDLAIEATSQQTNSRIGRALELAYE